jgi:hypothetical protein
MHQLVLAAALAGIAAGCQPSAKAPDPAPVAAPEDQFHEDAPVFDGAFLPVSKTAESITGNIAFDVNAIRFGLGHVYETAPVKLIEGAAADAAGAMFGVASADGMEYELRRVTAETLNPQAQNGGLCGAKAATFILLGGKYDPAVGSTDVYLGAYQGKDEPGPGAKDSTLCGTFMYERGP